MSATGIVLFTSAVWFAIGLVVGWCVTILAIRLGKEEIQSKQENDNNISIPTANDALFLSSLVTSGPKYDCMSKLFKKINKAIQNGQKYYMLHEDDIMLSSEIRQRWTQDEIIKLFEPYGYEIKWYLSGTSLIDTISWDNEDINSTR